MYVFSIEREGKKQFYMSLQLKDITKDSADRNRPVGVAFLDTGANMNHDIIRNLIRDSKNFVTDRQDGSDSELKALLFPVEIL